jgi:hypothetical protein
LILNEAYPEPDQDMIARIKGKNIQLWHIVG